jgi:hypothetical protein
VSETKVSERLPWADMSEASVQEIQSLQQIMDAERIIALIRAGKAGTTNAVLVPRDLEQKMPLLYSSLKVMAIYARIELKADPQIQVGTVNYPGVFSQNREERDASIAEATAANTKAAKAVACVAALADLAGRMPSKAQLNEIGGGRPVYRWFASLAILYYEEQVKKVPLSVGKRVLSEMDKDKQVILSLLKVFIGNEAAALRLLTAYEIALRKLASTWITQREAETHRDILVSEYYGVCTKDVSSFTMETCHHVKSKVKRTNLETKKSEIVEVINVMIPSVSTEAPMGIKEKLMIKDFNLAVKNVLFEECRGEPLTTRVDDTVTRIEKVSKRVGAAYTLCKRVNDLLRARRREALQYVQNKHESALKGVNLNPQNPKEVHALFEVVQPLWEKAFPNEDSLTYTIQSMCDGEDFEISISRLLNGEDE